MFVFRIEIRHECAVCRLVQSEGSVRGSAGEAYRQEHVHCQLLHSRAQRLHADCDVGRAPYTRITVQRGGVTEVDVCAKSMRPVLLSSYIIDAKKLYFLKRFFFSIYFMGKFLC